MCKSSFSWMWLSVKNDLNCGYGFSSKWSNILLNFLFCMIIQLWCSAPVCLFSLYMPPQQLYDLWLSGAAHVNQLVSSHPHLCWLCANNQCCICCCWLYNLYWLHTRYQYKCTVYYKYWATSLFFLYNHKCFYFYFLGDIFENYCRNDNLATFGRFCFGVSIITTFPLECFVTREVCAVIPRLKNSTDKRLHVYILGNMVFLGFELERWLCNKKTKKNVWH